MAKQSFTTGQVLTAAQMTSLQQTAMLGGAATAKTSSYVLVAADAGTSVIMNSGSATTVTVNTALFAAGDTVTIINQGAGICTVTAGTATVSTAGSLALTQNETGILYFLSASAAIFNDFTQASSASSGPAFQAYSTPTQSVSSTTNTKATMTNEAFDTDNCFASSRFTPTTAGYYLITGSISYTGAANKTFRVLLYKNGANYGTWNSMSIGPSVANPTLDNTVLMYLNGSTDYCELYGWTDATSPEFYSSTMQGVWVKS